MGKVIQPISDKDDIVGRKEATDLIREQIDSLHADAPKGQNPGSTVTPKSSEHAKGLIARFWHHNHNHPDKQTAWREYYESLGHEEQHAIWQEYYGIQNESTGASEPAESQANAQIEEKSAQPAHAATTTATAITTTATPRANSEATDAPASLADVKKQLLKDNPKPKRTLWNRLKPAIAAIAVMGLVFGLNYNDLVVAQVRQFITPGDSLQSPIIIDPNADIEVSDESRIIIPKINVDVPVVYDVTSFDERAIQEALERGVVHYGTTPEPGEPGNNVIVGHSSNNFLNSGQYKFAFVLLDRLEIGDTFILHHEGVRYIYRIYEKKVVEPTDFSVIQPTAVPTTTLITCTPPGTSWDRLVIQAEQISPEPAPEQQQSIEEIAPIVIEDDAQLAGNSRSFFQRIRDAIFGRD